MPASSQREAGQSGALWGAFGLAVVLLVLTWFWLTPARAADPVTPALPVGTNETRTVSAAPTGVSLPKVAKPEPAQPPVGLSSDLHLDKTPPRKTKGLDLVKMGWSYNCMECHKLLTARWHYDRSMVEHESVKLDHGNNRFCLNCHHATNRNAFVDYDGSEIAEADVVLLCAKCHGPTYRDWKAGVHGRRNGFWKASAGPQTRLRCIECHDPHAPKFKSMTPLPPPRYPARAPHPSGAGVELSSTH